MPSFTLWVTSQDFGKWKSLLRYISVVGFITIAFVVVLLKIFKFFCIDSASMEYSHLGFFWGAYSPNYCLILLKFWPEVSSNKTNTVFEKSFRILNFSLNRSMMEGTQSLQFCSILWPNLPLENQKCCWKPTFPQKLHP